NRSPPAVSGSNLFRSRSNPPYLVMPVPSTVCLRCRCLALPDALIVRRGPRVRKGAPCRRPGFPLKAHQHNTPAPDAQPVPSPHALPLRLKKNLSAFFTFSENIFVAKRFPATRLFISPRVG